MGDAGRVAHGDGNERFLVHSYFRTNAMQIETVKTVYSEDANQNAKETLNTENCF
jgi:hypothetical protein